MSQDDLQRSLRALRRRHVASDNIALVPASLLPFKHEWRQIADALPAGNALFVVPITGTADIRRSMKLVAQELRAHGRHVAAVAAESFVLSGSDTTKTARP